MSHDYPCHDGDNDMMNDGMEDGIMAHGIDSYTNSRFQAVGDLQWSNTDNPADSSHTTSLCDGRSFALQLFNTDDGRSFPLCDHYDVSPSRSDFQLMNSLDHEVIDFDSEAPGRMFHSHPLHCAIDSHIPHMSYPHHEAEHYPPVHQHDIQPSLQHLNQQQQQKKKEPVKRKTSIAKPQLTAKRSRKKLPPGHVVNHGYQHPPLPHNHIVESTSGGNTVHMSHGLSELQRSDSFSGHVEAMDPNGDLVDTFSDFEEFTNEAGRGYEDAKACKCGCLDRVAKKDQQLLQTWMDDAKRHRGNQHEPFARRVRKDAQSERRSHYKPEFEEFAKQWCLKHLRKDYLSSLPSTSAGNDPGPPPWLTGQPPPVGSGVEVILSPSGDVSENQTCSVPSSETASAAGHRAETSPSSELFTVPGRWSCASEEETSGRVVRGKVSELAGSMIHGGEETSGNGGLGGHAEVSPVACRFGDFMSRIDFKDDDDFKVCVRGAAKILEVSLGFFYDRSKFSQISRMDSWLGEQFGESRTFVKGCCTGSDLLCVKEDINFKTQKLLKVQCCSNSMRNRRICNLKQLLVDKPGLVQDWHDSYHTRHSERNKTGTVQQGVIGEALHAGVCRAGIRLLLNSQVSATRFKKIRDIVLKNGGNYRALLKSGR